MISYPQGYDERAVDLDFLVQGKPATASENDNLAETPRFVARLGDIGCRRGGFYGPSELPTSMNFRFVVPISMKTADFAIGKAVGQFRAVATSQRIQVAAHGFFSEAPASHPHELAVMRSDDSIYFDVPIEYVDKDLRLEAYDSKGNEIPVKAHLGIDINYKIGGTRERPVMLMGRPRGKKRSQLQPKGSIWYDHLPANVDHFTLKVRDYEWKRFKRVHLYPNSVGAG